MLGGDEPEDAVTDAPDASEADILKSTAKRLALLVAEGKNQTKELYKIAKEARKKSFEKCQ